MRCPGCGKEFEDSGKPCPHCEIVSNVTVLSPQEREQFRGVTIDPEPDRREERYYEYTSSGPNHRIHIRHVHIGSGGSFWKKFLISLAIMAVLAAIVLVALPLAMVIIAVIAVISFVFRLLR